MPRRRSPSVDKERSPLPQRHNPVASSGPKNPANSPPRQPIQSVYPVPGEVPILPQPTYSQTILQPPTLATDPSILPQQNVAAGSPSSQSRRQSASSMRNASTTFENLAPTSTPTGRISKAKKGKRVHACEYPGCGKVFTRAEHRRRHELNHNPEAIYRCPQPGCGKSFHRLDLLQRHQERHELDASPLPQSTPRHSIVFTSPPSVIPSNTIASPSQPSNTAPRTSGGLSIDSLVHPPPYHTSQYGATDPSLGLGVSFMPPNPTTYDESYFYGSDRSHSPASDNYARYHRQSISSASSVAAFDPQVSPMMTTSMPGQWMPATAPPIVMPSTVFEEGSTPYMPSPAVTSLPVPLHELDGHEYAAIQRELSTVPGLIFKSNGNTIRWDCLDHYWQYFHPSFPIVHKPTFLPAKPSPLLASAVLAIGSFYDTRPDAKLYSLALQESATRLLRCRTNISARSRIADLQTVLLLEILSKYCARHISAQTSSRFRALFASLHQSRQWLSTSPLAVFKAQTKHEKSAEDLKRAHKFWVEHETRRRIFHACSVLDVQQVALFEQRPTIVSHGKVQFQDAKDAVNLPCDEGLWEASTIEEWSIKAADCVYQDLNEARANYQTSSVSDYSFFQHQIINANGNAALRCSEEIESPPRLAGAPVSKTRFNYHVFQMAKHIPMRNLLIVAGESWLLGRKVEQETEYNQAKHIIREWVNQATDFTPTKQVANILQAHWHALKVLRMLIDPTVGWRTFRSTNMLHEDWSVYVAALVCWAHGYGRGFSPQTPVTITPRIISSTNSRKRKNLEGDNQPQKRHMPMPVFSNAMPAPSIAAHTTRATFIPPATSYANATFLAYTTPIDAYTGPWIGNSYYNTATTTGYMSQTELSATTTDASTYNSSVTTAPSTPPSIQQNQPQIPPQRKAFSTHQRSRMPTQQPRRQWQS